MAFIASTLSLGISRGRKFRVGGWRVLICHPIQKCVVLESHWPEVKDRFSNHSTEPEALCSGHSGEERYWFVMIWIRWWGQLPNRLGRPYGCWGCTGSFGSRLCLMWFPKNLFLCPSGFLDVESERFSLTYLNIEVATTCFLVWRLWVLLLLTQRTRDVREAIKLKK